MIVATITLIKMILIIMMIAVTSATLNIFYRCKILRVYKSFLWPGIETETTSRLRGCYSNGSVAWRHVVSKGFERACPLSCSGQKLPSSQHLPASLKVGEAWRGTQISLHMSMLLALPLALLNPITNLVLSDEMAMGQTSGLKQGWPSQGWLMQNDAKRRKNGRSDSLKKFAEEFYLPRNWWIVMPPCLSPSMMSKKAWASSSEIPMSCNFWFTAGISISLWKAAKPNCGFGLVEKLQLKEKAKLIWVQKGINGMKRRPFKTMQHQSTTHRNPLNHRDLLF